MRATTTLCLLLALALSTVTARAEDAEDPLCADQHAPLDGPLKRKNIQVGYPAREINQLGEGWARFEMNVTSKGTVERFWLQDAMGAPIYGERGAEALANATYEVPTRDGVPTSTTADFDFEFRMVGENRAQVHASFKTIYERARSMRDRGDYQGALSVLKEASHRSFNLYEMATLSYAFAVTYQGLKDWRRALAYISRATINDGEFADKGVRAAALAMAAELEAFGHRYRNAHCSFAALREQFPGFQPRPSLLAAVATADRELAGSQPVETSAQILASDRGDILSHWGHETLRSSFVIDQVRGNLSTFRLSCPGFYVEEPIRAGKAYGVPKGRCRLHVFGDPDAQFVLFERNQ